MKKISQDFTITARHSPNPRHVIFELQAPGALPEILPGQFTAVRIDNSAQVFLRRPLSFHDVNHDTGSVKLLVQIVGPGTRALSRLDPGQRINLLYPLGKGFTLAKEGPVLLAGGGCGSAPLLFLARVLHSKGIECDIVLGARSAEDLPEPDAYKAYGNVFTITDDGTSGEVGTVVKHSLFRIPGKYRFIYCCGPLPMMKSVASRARVEGIPCEVSLENTMACGIGACLCCVEPTDEGHVCVCTEGPVFNTGRLKWQI
jgi:dihydroorotate dehydrogenase electron transfer subunit